MRFARGMLGGLFFLAYGVGSLLIGMLLFPPLSLFGARRAMRASVRLSYLLFVGAARMTGLFRVDISPADRERLAATRGCVVVANHLTLIDIVILLAYLPDSTGIAKSAAGRNPFYSIVVRSAFLVNDDPVRVLDAAAKLLGAGTNLVVFPEGTRTPTSDSRHQLRRGAAQIALRAQVPVVPVQIACTPPVLAKGQPWYDLGARTIVWTLRVGETIPVPRTPSNLHAAACSLTRRIGTSLFGRDWSEPIPENAG